MKQMMVNVGDKALLKSDLISFLSVGAGVELQMYGYQADMCGYGAKPQIGPSTPSRCLLCVCVCACLRCSMRPYCPCSLSAKSLA